MSEGVIYLDYNATTPVAAEVLEKMLPCFTENFANAASFTHAPGRKSAEIVDTARGQIASLINAEPKDIIFTSGATESINLALDGATGFIGRKKYHIITTAVEHKAVLDTCIRLAKNNYSLSVLPVDEKGRIDLTDLAAELSPKTAIVSVQHANNEIGTIQNLTAIGELCREKEVLLHVDGAQSFGKIPIDVEAMKIDLLSISGHKIYGPKGIGALYVRRKNPRVRLKPQLLGGSQEREFRAGTLNVPGIAGLGAAAELAAEKMTFYRQEIDRLTKVAVEIFESRVEDVKFNGDFRTGLPGTLSISFPGVHARELLCELPQLALSTGSACASALPEPSHVLKALGLTGQEASSTVRLGIGRPTTKEEIQKACDLIVLKVLELRRKCEQDL